MTTIIYNGNEYELISTWTWGDVEIAQIRRIGYLHAESVPVAAIGYSHA